MNAFGKILACIALLLLAACKSSPPPTGPSTDTEATDANGLAKFADAGVSVRVSDATSDIPIPDLKVSAFHQSGEGDVLLHVDDPAGRYYPTLVGVGEDPGTTSTLQLTNAEVRLVPVDVDRESAYRNALEASAELVLNGIIKVSECESASLKTIELNILPDLGGYIINELAGGGIEHVTILAAKSGAFGVTASKAVLALAPKVTVALAIISAAELVTDFAERGVVGIYYEQGYEAGDEFLVCYKGPIETMILLVPLAEPGSGAETAALSVRVEDWDTLAPLAGASVQVVGPTIASATTDASGEVLFNPVLVRDAATYTLNVSKPGYAPQIVTVEVKAGTSVPIDVSLSSYSGLQVDLTGRWRGTWSQSFADGAIEALLYQSGSHFDGFVTVYGADCLGTALVDGRITSDGIAFGAISGSTTMDFDAIHEGEEMTGTFTVTSEDFCNGVTGNFKITRYEAKGRHVISATVNNWISETADIRPVLSPTTPNARNWVGHIDANGAFELTLPSTVSSSALVPIPFFEAPECTFTELEGGEAKGRVISGLEAVTADEVVAELELQGADAGEYRWWYSNAAVIAKGTCDFGGGEVMYLDLNLRHGWNMTRFYFVDSEFHIREWVSTPIHPDAEWVAFAR